LSFKTIAAKQNFFFAKKVADSLSNKDSLQDVIDAMSKYLTGPSLDFCIAQLKLGHLRKKQRPWSYSMKMFCLSFYNRSPSAYRFLYKSFCLPSVSTLHRLFSKVHMTCGISSHLISFLKTRVASMTDIEKYCSVAIDEMTVKAGLTYDPMFDKIIGFEDFGNIGETQEVGRQALVFMAQGIFKHWKQPLGYFIAAKTTPAATLNDLLLRCLSELHEVGLCVKVIVVDQGANNRALFNKFLKVSVESPYFVWNDNKIYTMFDPPHLLKSIRNNVMKHDIYVGDSVVSWKYIAKLYEIDSNEVTGLRLAPKLTKKHIELPPFAKMKVKLAAQVFSKLCKLLF
jgi:hypothetical protein